MKKIVSLFQIFGSLWIIYIFLWSLPYKFTNHEETQYIFWTIWKWLSETLWENIGWFFSSFWAYVIGTLEWIISILLIFAFHFIVKKQEEKANFLYCIAWFWAMVLMIWAVFFHMFTPLGIAVNNDWGSLFRAAVSIVWIWIFLTINNYKAFLKVMRNDET